MKITLDFCSTANAFSLRQRRFSLLFPPFLFAVLLMLAFYTDVFDHGMVEGNKMAYLHHRMLLNDSPDSKVMQPEQLGEKCSMSDIMIYQGPTRPLPSGIPAYTVEIMNLSPTVCKISNIHLKCGWFSSDNLINPKIFKRLCYDDCLVNDGMPLAAGEVLSFEYSSTYPFHLSVSSVSCP